MSRIVFDDIRPAVAVDPGRADIACFVGLVRPAGVTLPDTVQEYLEIQGWLGGPNSRVTDLTDPLGVPVPVENWPGFTAIFQDATSAASVGTDYLAEAVRMFFAQGGKRCYVVRTGDPVSPAAGGLASMRQTLLGNEDGLPTYAPGDPTSWRGVHLLDGLPEVSFVALPDLPALCASAPVGTKGEVAATPSGPEQFVECATEDITPAGSRILAAPAPRLTRDDYAIWATAIAEVLAYLSIGDRREVQLVTALPLPLDPDAGSTGESASSEQLSHDVHDVIASAMKENADPGTGISSSFLQLCYPWLKTSGSNALVESLAPPDGALIGILARNALTQGTFASAVKIIPSGVYDVWPALPAEDLRIPAAPLTWGDNSWKPLIQRVSLFGFQPAGLRLLSDVTTYAGESYRPARTNRLVSVIRRSARRAGDEMVFESSGPALWGRVRGFLQRLMTRLYLAGALDGASAQQAFAVSCGQSTMTQNDIDNGRVLAEVTFTAAATIELIRVSLGLQPAGASAQEIADALQVVV